MRYPQYAHWDCSSRCLSAMEVLFRRLSSKRDYRWPTKHQDCIGRRHPLITLVFFGSLARRPISSEYLFKSCPDALTESSRVHDWYNWSEIKFSFSPSRPKAIVPSPGSSNAGSSEMSHAEGKVFCDFLFHDFKSWSVKLTGWLALQNARDHISANDAGHAASGSQTCPIQGLNGAGVGRTDEHQFGVETICDFLDVTSPMAEARIQQERNRTEGHCGLGTAHWRLRTAECRFSSRDCGLYSPVGFETFDELKRLDKISIQGSFLFIRETKRIFAGEKFWNLRQRRRTSATETLKRD